VLEPLRRPGDKRGQLISRRAREGDEGRRSCARLGALDGRVPSDARQDRRSESGRGVQGEVAGLFGVVREPSRQTMKDVGRPTASNAPSSSSSRREDAANDRSRAVAGLIDPHWPDETDGMSSIRSMRTRRQDAGTLEQAASRALTDSVSHRVVPRPDRDRRAYQAQCRRDSRTQTGCPEILVLSAIRRAGRIGFIGGSQFQLRQREVFGFFKASTPS